MSSRQLKFVIAGGGTGGHLFPALSIAAAIKEKWNAEILFFGTKRGIENQKVPAAGYPIKYLPVAGFHRRLTLKNLAFPFKLIKSMLVCNAEIKKFDPDLVIGTGGYVMGPVLRTAYKLGIPFVIQEQNSYPGVTTRMMSAKASAIFVAYEEAIKHLSGSENVMVCGNPANINKVTFDRNELANLFGLDPRLRTMLVFGGSQGARNINNAVQNLINDTAIPKDYQILWQTGPVEFEQIGNVNQKQSTYKMKILPFIDDMASAYALADFAVCRAGAMTISELITAGLPAIFVPLASAAANHQHKNAQAIAEKGAALIVDDNSDLAANLQKVIQKMTSRDDFLKQMSNKMKALNPGDPIPVIINRIEAILRENGNIS